MYPGAGVVYSVLGLLLIWNGIISYFFWRERSFLRKLFPETAEDEAEGSILIRREFEKLLNSFEDLKRREEILKRTIRDFQLEGLRHVQKVEVIRYNPYADTGGSMSFSIAMLDGKDNGLVLTSLHTRSGTRIYTKEIREGKSELSLSKEEDDVLKKAASSA
jgi:hypothetical protein